MNTQTMSVTYENKFTDVMHFALYHYTRSPYMLGLLMVCVFMRNMRLIQSALEEPDLPLSFVGMNLFIDGVVMILIFLISLPIILFFIYNSKKNKSMFTSYNLSLLPDSLVEESPHGKLEINYPAIVKLCNTKKYLYIYRTKTASLIVPRRSFKDEAQWKDFYNVLLNKYNASNA